MSINRILAGVLFLAIDVVVPTAVADEEFPLGKGIALQPYRIVGDKEGGDTREFRAEFGFGRWAWFPAHLPSTHFDNALAAGARFREIAPSNAGLPGNAIPRSDSKLIGEVRERVGKHLLHEATWMTLAEVSEQRPLRALENLAARGVLASRPLIGNQNLAAILDECATEANATKDGPQRQRRQWLLAQLLIELDDPRTIWQSDLDACGPACIQAWMAMIHPAEFARIVVGLARQGRVALKTQGVEFTADDRPLDVKDDESRSLPSRLFQRAVVRFKTKAGAESDITTTRELREIYRAITGRELAAHFYDQQTGDSELERRSALVALLRKELQRTRRPALLLAENPDPRKNPESRHWYLILAVDEKGTARVLDTRGAETWLAAEPFARHARSLVVFEE